MVAKIAAGIILLTAILLSLPAYAANSGQPPTEAAALEVQAPEQQEVKSGAGGVDELNSLDLKYAASALVDSGRVLTSPLRWDTKDWLKVGLVVGATSGLFLADDELKDFSQKNQSPVASKFAQVGNLIGDPLFSFPSLGVFYAYGYLADDQKARRASLLAIESFVISGFLTAGIKLLAKRHRPETGHSSLNWDGPQFNVKNLSFSSGHTSSAFSIATIIAHEYRDNAFVPPIAYGLATLTGLSRIYSNSHWSSDTFFGAALGYFVSKAVLSYHDKDIEKAQNRLSVLPEIGKQMTGLTVKYDF